jgi:signal transduction histidine kinase
MSIRRKTLLIIGFTLVCLIAALYIVSQVIFLTRFVELEAQSVRRNVERALNALQDEMTSIHATNQEWAHWTDSYNFVDDLNANYSEGNTHIGVFRTYGLNMMLYADLEGEIVFQRSFDLVSGEETSIPRSLNGYLQPEGILLQHELAEGTLDEDGVQGILMLPEGVLIVASSPLLMNERVGPTRGSLIWGRFLDEEKLAELAERTQLTLEIRRVDDEILPADFAAALRSLERDPSLTVVTPLNETQVAGYTILNDIFGQPALIYRIDLPRDIFAQGQSSIFYFILSLIISGLVFGGVIVFLMEREVLSRLGSLTESVRKIRVSSDANTRVPVTGNDELTSLGDSINAMLAALAESNRQQALARDQAVEALKWKSQILANVSHDARTPLNIISLRIELFKRGVYGSLTDKQLELLDTVLLSSRQLLFFINNLLEQAHLDAGKITLEAVEYSPRTLIAEIQDLMLPLAQQKGLELLTDVADDVPTVVTGDPRRVNQIVTNLVMNAINFTDKGFIRIEACRVDERRWQIRVADSGAGIPQESLARIFEAFYQVDGTATRRVSSGVGLGLSIVNQLTSMMGGEVKVASQTDIGSQFTVILPQSPDESVK